jgi:hypothetical protein
MLERFVRTNVESEEAAAWMIANSATGPYAVDSVESCVGLTKEPKPVDMEERLIRVKDDSEDAAAWMIANSATGP